MVELDSGLAWRLVLCFLLGSIPFAVLAMVGTGIDIRQTGSGNPGFNNVLRVSKRRALLTLLGDMGKGYLAVWFARQAGDTIMTGWLYGLAATLGHCYSPWLRFNGGKGVATSGGVMLALYPGWAAIALAFFAVVRVAGGKLKWREAGMIGSLATWVLFTVLLAAFVGSRDASVAAAMTLFLAWRHKRNFQNLFAPAL
jgi:glycerol-3-phosphate acyltransferase PlsY